MDSAAAAPAGSGLAQGLREKEGTIMAHTT